MVSHDFIGENTCMTIDDVRPYALSLPAATEEPHHSYSSFRVKGRIFATIPPGGDFLHVFVDDERRELALAMYPDACENLPWGKKIVRVRVSLSSAEPSDVEDLLLCAWRLKAPKNLLKE